MQSGWSGSLMYQELKVNINMCLERSKVQDALHDIISFSMTISTMRNSTRIVSVFVVGIIKNVAICRYASLEILCAVFRHNSCETDKDNLEAL